MPNSRYYVFTINNPTAQLTPGATPAVGFCVWQLERGESGGSQMLGI